MEFARDLERAVILKPSTRGYQNSEAIGTLVLHSFIVGNVSMHLNENGVGSLEYIQCRDESLELPCRDGATQLQVYAEALQAAFDEGSELPDADCKSEDGNTSYSFSSQGSSTRMEDSHEWCSDSGGKSRGMSSSSLRALENVVTQVLESVRASGYGEEMCKEFREHFARLPAR